MENLELVRHFAGDLLAHQISQFLIAFTAAAWIHSGRVKKEIHHLTQAINNLADAFRKDLERQSDRITATELRIGLIEKANKGEL